MPLLTTDIQAPFDPTGYSSITGAQLLQFLTGAYPQVDKGFAIVSTDVATVPEVPDAASETKWQNYLWIRRSATSVSAYVWNPSAATDATYLKWIGLNISGIAVGSIVNNMIADNTITDAKIVSLDWSKLTGVPTTFAPGGAAGGDLTGTYPNPSVAPDAITTAKILDDNVTNSKIPDGELDITKLDPNAVAYTIPRTNVGATAVEWAAIDAANVTKLANITAGDALKYLRVNAAETAYEKVAGGQVLQTLAKQVGEISLPGNIPQDGSIPQIGEGTEIVKLTIIPLSASSVIRIRFTGNLLATGACTTALFKTGTNDALHALVTNDGGADNQCVTIEHLVASGSTASREYTIRAGLGAGTATWNNDSAIGAVNLSFLVIEEIIATLS